MRAFLFLLFGLLLLGCSQPAPEKPSEKPVSNDSEVRIIAGDYARGEPVAFQIKTSNYSIIYLNRSGGYSIGSYPSVWICKKANESCENVEYRKMRGFSTCEGGAVNVWIPAESSEKKGVLPAELYDLLLLWDQKDWKEQRVSCGNSYASIRRAEPVTPGNYSVTFVYWVSWDSAPRSVSADFRII